MLACVDGRDLSSTLLSPPVLGVGPVLCGLLAGFTVMIRPTNATMLIGLAAAMFVVRSRRGPAGSNAGCGSYLCAAGTGYDGPTGLGVPSGVNAFR